MAILLGSLWHFAIIIYMFQVVRAPPSGRAGAKARRAGRHDASSCPAAALLFGSLGDSTTGCIGWIGCYIARWTHTRCAAGTPPLLPKEARASEAIASVVHWLRRQAW